MSSKYIFTSFSSLRFTEVLALMTETYENFLITLLLWRKGCCAIWYYLQRSSFFFVAINLDLMSSKYIFIIFLVFSNLLLMCFLCSSHTGSRSTYMAEASSRLIGNPRELSKRWFVLGATFKVWASSSSKEGWQFYVLIHHFLRFLFLDSLSGILHHKLLEVIGTIQCDLFRWGPRKF